MDRLRVLIAGDDRGRAVELSSLLASLSHADVIETAVERLGQELSSSRYDAILLHIENRSALARSIDQVQRSAGPTPVIVVSTLQDQDVVIDCLSAGVADFIPVRDLAEPAQLAVRVKDVIERGHRRLEDRRQLKRRLSTLRQLACRDPLTGVFNRRHAACLLSSRRQKRDRRRETALVMLDLDHFKSINDAHGHSAGDRVLADVAGLVQRHAGPADAVVRWGGEEFLVIRRSSSVVDAWTWTDGVLSDLRTWQFDSSGAKWTVTASAGIAVFPTEELCEDSVHVADHALYLAKDLGRNRICTADMVTLYDTAHTLQTNHHGIDAIVSTLAASIGCGGDQTRVLQAYVDRVQVLATAAGKRLALSTQELARLRRAALLCCLGKLAIPTEITQRDGPLSDAERRLIADHMAFGVHVCAALGYVSLASVAACVEGRGTCTDERSELLGSIVHAARAIVAMTSHRPYAPARRLREAIEEVKCQKRHCCPAQVADSLMGAAAEFSALA